MNQTIIKNWNDRVSVEDTVFHLGDFGLIKSGEAPDAIKDTFNVIRNQLNGNIIFLKGNHDSQNKNKSVIQSMVIEHGGKRIFLTHDPKFADEGFYFNFCGHCHGRYGKFRKLSKRSVIVDLSVDCWDYRPVDITEIYQAHSFWLKGGKNEIK
jgi:calcineurin-like phosphoesterase family protein